LFIENFFSPFNQCDIEQPDKHWNDKVIRIVAGGLFDQCIFKTQKNTILYCMALLGTEV